MRTAKELSAHFDSMTDYFAIAMFARRGKRLNGAFKAVERMPGAGRNDVKGFVIVVAANFTLRH
jgi:hypothetical protein